MDSFFVVNASSAPRSHAEIRDAVESADRMGSPLIVVIHGGLVEPGSFSITEKALAIEFARRNLVGLCVRWDSGFWQTAHRLMQKLHQHPFVRWAISFMLNDTWGMITFSESEKIILTRRLAERLQFDQEFQAVWRAARKRKFVPMDSPNLQLNPEFGCSPTFFVAWGLVSCAMAIRTRMLNGTGHGLQATTVEELLRTFFLGEIGKAGWQDLKFAAQSAGTCQILVEALVKGRTPVGILAHSAGAIVGLNLATAFDNERKHGQKAKLALLAPAISVREAQNFSRISKDSMIFGLSDETELTNSAFPLYPASILCLLSALFEAEPSDPILGMQRSQKGRWGLAKYLWSDANLKGLPQSHQGMLHPYLPIGQANEALDFALRFLISEFPEPKP